MFGFLRYAALFLLWLLRIICARSFCVGNPLVWKTKQPPQNPLFSWYAGCFPSLDWMLILSCPCCWSARPGRVYLSPHTQCRQLSVWGWRRAPCQPQPLVMLPGLSVWNSFLPYLPWRFDNCFPQTCLHFLCSSGAVFVIFLLECRVMYRL